ncbi:MAG: hypothetical protein JW954_06990 [Dehalococcoidaceae bacterium]|nr:hypothetical protein [Dehalococcoidaceae bacterium]
MLSIKFEGDTLNSVAIEARKFADAILGGSSSISYEGYLPLGVGKPEYFPVDDGREWGIESIKDWLGRLNTNGQKVVKVLAEKQILDPREEAGNLGWAGTHWAGTWTSPRRQAGYVMESRGLRSWPYGHTYEEPRKMWMHPDIARIVLEVLE